MEVNLVEFSLTGRTYGAKYKLILIGYKQEAPVILAYCALCLDAWKRPENEKFEVKRKTRYSFQHIKY